jgi:site-specific DNA recombinase
MEAATMARQRRDTSDLRGLRTGVYLRVSRADKDDKKFLDAERSTATQRRVFGEWAERSGVTLTDEYPDPDISASRFAVKKNRPEFERMRADVKAGKLDVLWFWELSRQQRRLSVFADLRDLCRDMGVLWVVRDRVADPANSKDMLLAGIQSMIAEDESETLSGRVFDGKESSALNGKRAGRFPYGYKRGKWNPETEKFGPDVPDEVDGDDVAVQDSPAAVVREIFDRVNGGESVTSIRKSLNDRGVRTKAGAPWANSTVRYIAMNPAYAGMRVRHLEKGGGLSRRSGNILEGPDGKPVKTKWPPLVSAETFWIAYRILADPARLTSKPHRPGDRLLAGIARCGECGCKLTTKLANSRQYQRADTYACREKGCTGIYQPDLDAYVEKVMVAWLSDPATAAALQRGGDQAALELARADAERERAALADWRRDAERGEVTLAGYKAFEKGALTRIADAEERATAASGPPPILRDRIGPAAAAGWAALDIPIKRQIIAAVADIRLRRVGRHGRRLIPAADRVDWHWLTGDAVGTTAEPSADVIERIGKDEAARLAGRRTKVMHLRESGLSRAEIAAELGMTVGTVKKDITASLHG